MQGDRGCNCNLHKENGKHRTGNETGSQNHLTHRSKTGILGFLQAGREGMGVGGKGEGNGESER